MCEFSFLLEPKWSSTTIVTRQNKIEPKVKVPSEEDHQEKFFFCKKTLPLATFFLFQVVWFQFKRAPKFVRKIVKRSCVHRLDHYVHNVRSGEIKLEI